MNSSQATVSNSRRSLGFLFAVLGGLAAPLMPFVNRAPTTLVIIGCIGGAILLWRRGTRPAQPDFAILSILACLLAWAGFSAIWAIDAAGALAGTAKLAGNIAVGMFLIAIAGSVSPGEARLAGKMMTLGCFLTMIFIAAEMVSGAPLSRIVGNHHDANEFSFQLQLYGAYWFNAAISVLTLMIWPVLANWRNQSVALLALLPIAVALLAWTVGFGAGIQSVAIGSLAAFLMWLCDPWGRRLLAVLLALGILAAPLLPRTILLPERMSEWSYFPTRDMPRFYIWAFAAERIAERPLLGWGMNASRNMPGGKEQIVDHVRNRTYGEEMPLHPHNFALQAWLELGLVGALLTAGLVARVVMFGARPPLDPRSTAAVTGLAATALVQFSLSYGAWQSWWLSSIFLAAAFMVIALRRSSD